MELANIKIDGQYTLLIENSFGFIVSRKVKIKKAFIQEKGGYSRHKDLVLHYIEKGKRKLIGIKFTENKIAIMEGWQDIKGTFEDENINTFESFEMGKFEEVLKLNRLTPILKHNL